MRDFRRKNFPKRPLFFQSFVPGKLVGAKHSAPKLIADY